ncbi:DUF924 domain-containing protein [Roseococcus sp. SYP-B2431]|uniref:DUF924 family protein n=1 Tax=Roseococcus sp. SYP-B2431 TaxID=2496640 RepID=UPI00103869D9|nr:DUF924 family protein [Roseococcus sp. SYP-B2431]TCH99399.1 DUF924 domain-containing protein [Roseococcus sp. SYP-B2431]
MEQDLIRDILDFWFRDGRDGYRELWFRRDDAFDAEIRARFGGLVIPAREGRFNSWADTPEGALALAILLDQFPRNLFRGSPEAFASDPQALVLARRVIRERLDLDLTPVERGFLYLPLEHAESMAAQNESVAAFEGLRDVPQSARPGGTIDYAWRHWHVIRRFGRFPHRNAVLGRDSTLAEQAYLAQPGAGF